MTFGINDSFKAFLRQIVDSKTRHSCYTECCDHAQEMSVHLYGTSPDKLLNSIRPREDQETKDYRLGAYQPTTKATAGKALSILMKIFNPSLYSIRWKDQSTDGKKLENYTLHEYPWFNSVMNFLSDSVMKKMLADPNAIMAIRPRKLAISQEQAPQAVAKVYGSPNVWYYDEEMYLIYMREETPEVGYGTKQQQPIYYFEYYDATYIIEFSVEFPNAQSTTIKVISFYQHGCPDIPVWSLQGVPEILDNGAVMYKSFFDDALPFWNYAVAHESDLLGAYINHLHPLRAELAEECDYKQDGQRCKAGYLPTTEKGVVTGNVICPGCHGSGYRSVKSPYGVYQYSKEKLEGSTSALTPVEYITVPTDATKMLEDRVERMHDKGLNALNMDVVNRIGENQSGVAKEWDRSELYDFLGKISSVMFDIHLNNIFYYFNIQMFKVSSESKPQSTDPLTPNTLDKNLPEINKPASFDIATSQELLNELNTSNKAGVNLDLLKLIQKEYASKKFATSTDSKLTMDLIFDLDPIGDYPVADIMTAQATLPKKWLDEWVIIHFNIGAFIARALDEDEKGFLAKEKDQKFDVLMGFADEVIAGTKVTLDVSGVQSDTQQQAAPIEDPVQEQ